VVVVDVTGIVLLESLTTAVAVAVASARPMLSSTSVLATETAVNVASETLGSVPVVVAMAREVVVSESPAPLPSLLSLPLPFDPP
jgi:hypothetical protein